MTTGLRVLLILVITELSVQLQRGPVLKQRHGPGFKHDHLLDRQFLAKKAHLMSNLKPMPLHPSSFSSLVRDIKYSSSFGIAAKGTMLPMNMLSRPNAKTISGGHGVVTMTDSGINNIAILNNEINNVAMINSDFSNAINTQGFNTGMLETLTRDLTHIVNAVPNVVSVKVGSPDIFTLNNPVNNEWGLAVNGEAFGDTFKATDTLKSQMIGNNIDFPTGNLNNELNSNGENGPYIPGFLDPSTSGRDNNIIAPRGISSNTGSYSNAVDTFGEIVKSPGTLSVSSGVQVFQSTLNNGGNLFELVLPEMSVSNATGVVKLSSRSEGIPNKDSLQPDQSFVNINAQAPEMQVAELNQGSDVTDGFLSGITNMVPASHHVVNFQDISGDPGTGGVQVSPASVKDTLLSFENAHKLIPIISKSRDLTSHSGTPQENVIADTSHIPNLTNSGGLQTVTVGIDNVDTKQSSNARARTYDPFSTRLKPEAFGPGPYYECTPPARVVCGARIGWDDVIGMADWCKENCVVFNYSSYCDDDRCRCKCTNPDVKLVQWKSQTKVM